MKTTVFESLGVDGFMDGDMTKIKEVLAKCLCGGKYGKSDCVKELLTHFKYKHTKNNMRIAAIFLGMGEAIESQHGETGIEGLLSALASAAESSGDDE